MNTSLLSDRLRWAIERKRTSRATKEKITQAAIAKVAEVSPTAVGYWLADTNGISAEQARKVGAFLSVDPVWLEKGVGEPVPGRPGDSSLASARTIVLTDEETPGQYLIPMVKLRLQAGITGFQAESDSRDGGTVGLSRKWVERRGLDPAHLIAMQVRGESMEPTFYEDDTVVINLADKSPTDNGVFAVNYDGEAVVKRLSRDEGKWWLLSDNADQRRFYRRVCQGAECIIVGRVVRREGDHF
jgi:phage repressor protein C with HTH and peptisase S24 domain